MKKLQNKLIQTLLLTSTLPLIILAVITVIFLHDIAVNDAQQRITNNLNIARSIYENAKENLKYTVRDENRRIFTLLESSGIDTLRDELIKYAQKNKLDFFAVTDPLGKVIVSINNLQAQGADLGADNYVQKALKGEALVSSEILSGKRLLAIKAGLPVINRDEKIVGTMSAGFLLNNNRIFLDDIKRSTGLVSEIFLGDTRVASNIPPEKVKYISGSLPIYNSNDSLIGSVAIGIPETRIFALRNNLVKILGIAVLISILLALIFGISRGGAIVRSVEKLRQGTEAVIRGDFLHRIDIYSKDEIEELARVFNKMTQQLRIARSKVEEYSRGLQDKVEEKTAQLELAHKKLVEYEKMAAMGRMATTLGHELRNVFAGIRTVVYNLKSKVANTCPDSLNSVKDLEYEVNYGNEILDNVLRFSLPKKLILQEADMNLVIEEVLSSLNLEEVFKDIEVNKDFDPFIPKIKADSVQIKEVILNIIINATQAMSSGGKLNIKTVREGEFMKLNISDTGSGIPKKVLNNLFVPFFTTKSRGLGLGLFISNEIVKAHGGKIEIQTELNKGTIFTISLPLKYIENA